ncbi:MAG: hypothetical protein M1813_007311 [Trichoglossum hirsutum]|nr:MAG: hypothetical protein M1813_007311 [Trichoglossum hirsutum]
MAKIKTKKKPSAYSALPFHLLRFTQLVSSLIVSAIMFYFIYHLRRDHFKVPWTFLVLLGVALFTIMTQTVTIVFYFCRALNPTVNLAINAMLSVFWATGFGLLTWAMSGTLVHKCNATNWGNDAGVMVCRLYKALFTFSLTGLIATFSALILDFMTRKKELVGGRYIHANDNKSTAALRLTEPRDSGGPFDVPRAYAAEQESGYSPPSEQQRYTDTEYHHHS